MQIPVQFRKWLLAGTGVLLLTNIAAQKPELLSDSALTSLVTQRAGSIMKGPWFREITGYHKQDSTIIKRVEAKILLFDVSGRENLTESGSMPMPSWLMPHSGR